MSEPFVGELRCFGFNFAPADWAFCNGQLMSISNNEALFALIGTTYGGDGQNTFALPDLRSRVPIHQGTNSNGNGTYFIGASSGTENVTLLLNEIPAHTHSILATTNTAVLKRPTSGTRYAASSSGNTFYAAPASTTAIAPTTVATTGGNLPHSNIQPYLTLNWCIALFGVFPTRN
jgi:microcystin-dependent protein